MSTNEDQSKSPAAESAVAPSQSSDDKALAKTSNEVAKKDGTTTALSATTTTKKKRRPARPQVDPETYEPGKVPVQTGVVFNIWYNKWSGGDREDKYISKHHAEGRCNVAKDSGYTKADRVPGSYFCLFFARGLCPHGHHCEYLHRLPTVHDLFNPNIDCFGRDKHSDYRDDMGGVGSFMRQNRTLYIGRIHVTDEIEEIVARHFAEWGQIERIRVLNSRGVAFVTYVNEANGQFAKEAMAHQSLDHSEILNVRWATQDPNPLAQARDKRRIEEQAAEAIRKALPAEYIAELEGKGPDAKKRRKIESGFGLQGFEAPEDVWYNRGIDAVNPAGRAGYEQLEGVERAGLIEGGPLEEEEESGLLGGSALEALRQFKERNKEAPRVTVAAPGSAAPLVGYGSDDDSD